MGEEKKEKEVKGNAVKEKEVKPKKNKVGFGKTVVLPFFCGVVGAGVVLGTCFGIPGVRDKIRDTLNPKEKVVTKVATGASAVNQVKLTDYSNTAIEVADKVLPSIVGIEIEYTITSAFYGQSSTATASGSGVIITEDGYILTNNHVVNSAADYGFYSLSEANKIIVYLYNDETEYEAKIVGCDEITDLAVIKIEKTDLKPIKIGNSEELKIGQFVMAVGNPLGLQSTVTTGVVSALDREIEDEDGKSFVMIQTDAAINSGNSGGALVDTDGNLVGINSAKASGEGIEGIGFAIPIDTAVPIYNQLAENGKVIRPYLGIGGRDINEKTAKRRNLVEGIYVVKVEEFSAAEKAGIEPGDVIVKFDGEEVKTMNELNNLKNTYEVGDEVTITINRSGEEKEINLVLGDDADVTEEE